MRKYAPLFLFVASTSACLLVACGGRSSGQAAPGAGDAMAPTGGGGGGRQDAAGLAADAGSGGGNGGTSGELDGGSPLAGSGGAVPPDASSGSGGNGPDAASPPRADAAAGASGGPDGASPDARTPDAAALPPDAGAAGMGGAARGPLRVDPTNPRYFNDGAGHIVYLTGSHTWQTLKDRGLTDPPPAFDYPGFLEFLVAHKHNYFRLWTWEQPRSWNNNTDNLRRYFQPFAWPRTGPGLASDGKPRFDLEKFDQTYFDRIRARVAAAGARGVYVAVTLFDGWDLANAYNAVDGGFPPGTGNNVNGLTTDPARAQTLDDPAALRVQEAYVRKVIDTVNDQDNVLYEIANETNASGVTWQYHMIDLIKQYEAGKPRQHPVGMTSTYPGSDDDLFRSHADWIAPNGKLVNGDGRKVIINDTDHSYYWTFLKNDGPAAHRAWAWTTLMIGASPSFMDPYLEPWSGRNSPSGATPDPYWETMRNALGDTRMYADKLDLRRTVPSPALSSTGQCLANPGSQYLVYQPGSGAFTLKMIAGTYAFEWFNPAIGSVAGTGQVTVAAEVHSFTPPFSGDAVLLLSLM
jgi:hypothetical protein